MGIHTSYDAELLASRIEAKARRCLRGDGFKGSANRVAYIDLVDSLRVVAGADLIGQRVQLGIEDADHFDELVEDVVLELIELIDGTVI